MKQSSDGVEPGFKVTTENSCAGVAPEVCLPKPPTILCADPSTVVGDAVAAVFSTAGYLVERATNGDEAWAKLCPDLSRFDVLIADHEITALSALQFIGRARDSGYTGRVIVFCRALTDDDAKLYREMGVEALVASENDSVRLLGVVKAYHRVT